MPAYLWDAVEETARRLGMNTSQYIRLSCLRAVMGEAGTNAADLIEHAKLVGISKDVQRVGVCAQCGAFFADTSGRRKYCRAACKTAAYRSRVSSSLASECRPRRMSEVKIPASSRGAGFDFAPGDERLS